MRRRGIIVGGIVLGLLLGCNNGLAEDLAAQKRLGEIGRSTENVFYSFMGLIADTLGFRVTKEKTKKEIGDYFSKLGGKVGEASEELEKVAEKAVTDGSDKDGLLSKVIKEAVEAAKTTLSALKGIFEIAKIQQVVKEPSSSSVTLQQASIGVASPQDVAKILATGGGTPGAVGDKAALIVSAVSGEEILAEIVKSKDSDVATDVGSSADASTSALKFANGHVTSTNLNKPEAKAAAVAGGIALRSLVKNGQLAAGASTGSAGGQGEVQGIGITAVNKLLVAVEDIIKKTVKKTLEKAKTKIDEARKPKAVGNE